MAREHVVSVVPFLLGGNRPRLSVEASGAPGGDALPETARRIRAKGTPMTTAMKWRRLGALLALVGVLANAGVSAAIPRDFNFQPVDNPDAGPLGTSVFGINSPG